jgi:glycosidase
MGAVREFHILRSARERFAIEASMFSSRGTMVFTDLSAARRCIKALNAVEQLPDLRTEDLYAMGLIDEAFHILFSQYRESVGEPLLSQLYERLAERIGENRLKTTLDAFTADFPPTEVFLGTTTAAAYLKADHDGETGYEVALEELLMLYLSNENPGYAPGSVLIDDAKLRENSAYLLIIEEIRSFFGSKPVFGPDSQDLFSMFRAPALLYPDSLQKQLEYIRDRWGFLLGDLFLKLLRAIDYLNEVNAFAARKGAGFTKGIMDPYSFSGLEEYERFSADSDWMPNVVLLAKSTLVWLHQLSRQYGREIRTLDQIPDEELDQMASRGFNALWLIGLWERSDASRQIKHRCGNPDAAASAYALYNSEIAWGIGGWDALQQLKERCARLGIRLASDMVPNHTGIDSEWVHNHPDWYLQLDYPPYPSYSFNSENLSSNPGIGIYLEDHYYDRSDASVVFKRVDFGSGETRYIYHGNDGTHMPWNDTAQLNYLLPEVREAVIQTILHVARNFPIIRFDAAMTLAKKHIHRLWFPEPGSGGDIASRAEHGMTWAEFNRRMPVEFWREVVDRVAEEVPDTLLLAEAFWMMEGYFVRTLGMHRVYNSAFMHMLKNEDNAKYRQTIKNTIEFDKDILKRFVNFMNNPDEDTAIAQFGDGDKYFGVCTLMVTLPGLPMIGHGQVEGYTEKYGMEFQRAYKDEQPNQWLVERHEREIFPLMKKRYLFSGVDNFFLFDFYADHGVNENVFVYTNATPMESALVAYNNCYDSSSGYIKESAGYVEKTIGGKKHSRRSTLAAALHLHDADNAWMLFREAKTGLWYIRKSSEIHENGMFIALKGYEAQVFLDIHEVWDNQFHHYRQLHDRLGGRGVTDVGQAIRDIVLRPVYDAFTEYFTAEYVDKFVDFLRKGGKKTAKQKRYFVDPYKVFVESVIDFTNDPDFANKSAATFAQGIDNISRLIELEGETPDAPEFQYFLKPVHSQYNTETRMLSFLILHSLERYDEEWYLEGKIIEKLGFDPGVSTTFRWLETYEVWSGAGSAIKPEDLAEALRQQSVQDAIGSNYFNGEIWFNREAFEDFCWWTGCYHLMTAKSISAALVKKAWSRSADWLSRMEKSGYLANKLIPESRKPAAKKATENKPAPKKATENKPAAKKTAAKKPAEKKPAAKGSSKTKS